MRKVVFLIFLISFLLPSFETRRNTYQTSLWTYSDFRKSELPIKDVVIKTNKDIRGLQKWTRIRLGLLVKPITIDYQKQYRIVQIRMEPYYLIPNLVIAFLLSIFSFGIRKLFFTQN